MLSRPPVASFVVPPHNNRTLASLLHDWLQVSHQQAKAAVFCGKVLVAGRPQLDPVSRPAGGLEVEVCASPPASLARPATKTLEGPGFRILSLDPDLVVVDKQAGVVTVPTSEEDEETSLVARVAAALALSGHRAKELFVVHRIDRWTSGLVLIARRPGAFESLRSQFRARTPLREYLAWTEGVPVPEAGELVHTLSEEPRSRRVLASAGRQGGREARLAYWVEKSTKGPPPAARVRIHLVTGRRNQIRVQFASAGWPLAGDRFYGAKGKGPGRTALHAYRLEFEHPGTNARASFLCPLPPDLRIWNRNLFRR